MVPPNIRTPFGGMNQDDSLITPSKDAAGKNMFEIGDYRYALNARIGSSRTDHFGDLENILATAEVTDYFAATNVMLNPNFSGSLDNWSQTDDPAQIDWVYNSQGARVTINPSFGPSAGPAPAYSAKGTASGTDQATCTPQYPAGILANDLMFLIAISKQPDSPGTIITPAGWTLIQGGFYGGVVPGSTGYCALFYKIAAGGETGSVVVSRNGPTSGLNTFMGQIYTWRGVAPIVDASNFNQFGMGTSTVNWPAVAVNGLRRNVLAFVAQQSATPPNTPAGYIGMGEDSIDTGPVSLSTKVSAKNNVSTDGVVTASGGHADGWFTFHVSIFDPVSTPIPTPFATEVIYQTPAVPIENQQATVSFNFVASNAVTDAQVKVVFMSGATVIGEEVVATGSISRFAFSESMTIPAGCDGVGLQLLGTVEAITTVDLKFFNLILSVGGTRPPGDEKVIGKVEDYENLRVYYCVWNSLNHHTIRYWDYQLNGVFEVLRWSGLNFSNNSFVKLAKLDNWIAFTDRINAPRLIDVNTITALQITLGSEFREFHISHHKWAPLPPPIGRIFYDGITNNYEKLKDKVIHFSYRYIYKGNLKSRWSPISKGVTTCMLNSASFYGSNNITSIELDIPGCIFNDPTDSGTEYNFFDHNDIKFQSAVDFIEVAFQDGELELWKLWKRIRVDAGFSRLHYFSGDGNLTPIPQDDFTQLFDTVPFLAGTVEAIDNRFVYGDILDEKPAVEDIDIKNIGSVDNVAVGDSNWGDPRQAGWPAIPADAAQKLKRLNAGSQLTFKDRSIHKLGLQFLYPQGWRTGVYTTDEWSYEHADLAEFSSSGIARIAFKFTIPSSFVPPEGAVAYQIMRTNSLNVDYFMFGIVNKFAPIIDDLAAIFNQLDLPDNVKDRIRQHFENTRNINGDDVIAETQRILQMDIDNNKKRDRRVKVGNTILAVNRWIGELSGSAGFAMSNRNLQKWLKRNPIGPKLQQELRKSKEISVLADASRIRIDINNWYFGARESVDKEYPLNKLFYNFREGDRVRFTGSEVANPLTNQLREYDVPIIEFTGQSIIIERPADLLWISKPDIAQPYNFNIEVYTPKQSMPQDHIFYEMGEWYPILFPGQPNRDFSKRDFGYTNNTAITLTQQGPFDIYHKMPVFYGDVYLVNKTVYRDKVLGPASSQSPMFLSMNPDLNKTFDYWDTNNGRIAIAYSDLPVAHFKTTQMRFSGKIIEESFVNNLAHFRDEDNFIYPSEYGRIRNIINTSNAQVESVGSILLVLGERESWSVYVNRTTLEDLSGRTQVGFGEDVLGSYNTLLGSHGTLNPESVSSHRGRVYWWDALDGSWVRYGRDGLTEISEYKMRNWFKDLGDLIASQYLNEIKPLALSEFDAFNEELLTFQDHATLPSSFRGYTTFKGAIFSEDDTRWKSIHSFNPEMMSKMVNQVIMFRNGNVYLHEKGPEHSKFFDTKYQVHWEPVFNDNAQFKKAWKALAVVATDKWSVERILSEYRGLKTKQETRIQMADFVEKEDNFYAHLKRDINTPNIANAIIEGNELKCKAIQVLMQLDPAVVHKSLLHYTFAEVTDSPKNV